MFPYLTHVHQGRCEVLKADMWYSSRTILVHHFRNFPAAFHSQTDAYHPKIHCHDACTALSLHWCQYVVEDIGLITGARRAAYAHPWIWWPLAGY